MWVTGFIVTIIVIYIFFILNVWVPEVVIKKIIIVANSQVLRGSNTTSISFVHLLRCTN